MQTINPATAQQRHSLSPNELDGRTTLPVMRLSAIQSIQGTTFGGSNGRARALARFATVSDKAPLPDPAGLFVELRPCVDGTEATDRKLVR